MNMTSKFNRNISGDLFLPFNEIPTISNASHFRWKMGGSEFVEILPVNKS